MQNSAKVVSSTLIKLFYATGSITDNPEDNVITPEQNDQIEMAISLQDVIDSSLESAKESMQLIKNSTQYYFKTRTGPEKVGDFIAFLIEFSVSGKIFGCAAHFLGSIGSKLANEHIALAKGSSVGEALTFQAASKIGGNIGRKI